MYPELTKYIEKLQQPDRRTHGLGTPEKYFLKKLVPTVLGWVSPAILKSIQIKLYAYLSTRRCTRYDCLVYFPRNRGKQWELALNAQII